jgi:hypothetical protein
VDGTRNKEKKRRYPEEQINQSSDEHVTSKARPLSLLGRSTEGSTRIDRGGSCAISGGSVDTGWIVQAQGDGKRMTLIFCVWTFVFCISVSRLRSLFLLAYSILKYHD